MQFQPFVFIFFSFVVAVSATTQFSNETDQQALLAIRDQINIDPYNALNSWNDSLNFCSWQGVSCGLRHKRVTALNLQSLSLSGTLAPDIGNLTFLRVVDLGGNNFRSSIPQDIGRLTRLRQLVLWNNSFDGYIPTNLTQCSQLEVILMNTNRLIGQIPPNFGSYFPRLTFLALAKNNLTGSIPSSFGNLSYLMQLSLGGNNLEGSIPDDLGRLSNIGIILLALNHFSGKVPSSLYNISSLQIFSIAFNSLQGQLPPDFGLGLPNLQQFYIGRNQFSGLIPESMANASSLAYLGLGSNHFTGPLPLNFGNLQYLKGIQIHENPFFTASSDDDNSNFFSSLINCTNLSQLFAFQTNLTGVFPKSITNLTTNLTLLRLDQNSLIENIPLGIGNLINLAFVYLDGNMLSGSIPDSVQKLQKLQYLNIGLNMLSGEIPPSIGNISSLGFLNLLMNRLNGSIPASLGNCKSLQNLVLAQNNLTGEIPVQIFGLPSPSIGLSLGYNRLSGPLPLQVGNLKNIQTIEIRGNELSGELPGTLGNCLMLENLYLAGNNFKGPIPSSFQQLKSLRVLDLSGNNLTGQIPEFLGNFSYLTILNLSFNDLEGQVPVNGIFANLSGFSILGNKRLCGGIQQLQLPPCPSATTIPQKKRKYSALTVIIISVIICAIFVVLLSAFVYWRRRPKQPISSSELPTMKQYREFSFGELRQATNEFSSANLLGKGNFGTVYKGVVNSEEELIAVKVFNLEVRGANKSFLAECEALKNIRHRNLVKILSICSSIDFKGNDFKALVYEFMPKGNLDSWLHPAQLNGPANFGKLNFIQRLNIAIDVANALEYLHHHCSEPVIHCDLKPSNVLLDNDLTAHVCDFGLARLLQDSTSTSSVSQSSSIGVRGTIGYVAPEYGICKEVSTQGDSYSYGVLLLELFTGKRPTDATFNENNSLHSFVDLALLNDQVMQILDPRLMLEEEDGEEESTSGITSGGGTSNNPNINKCLASIFKIGVACSADSPRERIDIRDVLKELHAINKLLR